MEDFEYAKGSFADRHPVIAWAVIIGFVVVAGLPAVAMLHSEVACIIGAAEAWCAPSAPPR